jgi:CDP-glycerol glycerophosphotransferase (TagB/SpsB family)
MRLDYLKYVSPLVVKALGHPKFDRLYSKDTLPVDRTLIERGAGRKVVLLKIHWTKKGGGKVYTPDLSVYMEFVKLFGRYDDLFFAVMPHPNFFHNSNKFGFGAQAEKFRLLVESMPNAMLCLQSDYRPVLVVSDYIITDRSSVMVEAGVLDVPVMYMTGKDWEPLNDAVQPIIMSYYLGKTCEDMVRFLEMCREGHDPKRTERQAAVREYIPYFDGKCGERIAQDMIDGVKNMG